MPCAGPAQAEARSASCLGQIAAPEAGDSQGVMSAAPVTGTMG